MVQLQYSFYSNSVNFCNFLGYDCPIHNGLYDYMQLVAGSSIDAAKALNMNSTKIAINWGGGWHHAKQ